MINIDVNKVQVNNGDLPGQSIAINLGVYVSLPYIKIFDYKDCIFQYPYRQCYAFSKSTIIINFKFIFFTDQW